MERNAKKMFCKAQPKVNTFSPNIVLQRKEKKAGLAVLATHSKHLRTRRLAKRLWEGHSPVTGLVAQTCPQAAYKRNFPTHSLAVVTAGAHLGGKPARNAQSGSSALMHSQLSGSRDTFPLINYRSISTQLLRTQLLLALLLSEGARVLLVNNSDEQQLPQEIVVTPLQSTTYQARLGEGTLLSFGGVCPGICSNWMRIREGVWNLMHSSRFFARLAQQGAGKGGENSDVLLSLLLKEKKHSFQGLVTRKKQKVVRNKSLVRRSNGEERHETGLLRTSSMNIVEQFPILHYSNKPDVLLLINSRENLSLVGEAQAQRIPVIKLANTEGSLIHPCSAGISSNGVVELIANSQSASWMFFLSSLLSQMSYRD